MVYEYFNMIKVGPASDGYRLHLEGRIKSTDTFLAALVNHSNAKFSTFDKDQDNSASNCAAVNQAGWWYHGVNCGAVRFQQHDKEFFNLNYLFISGDLNQQ